MREMDLSFDTSFADYWKAAREHLDCEFERALPRFFDRLPAAHVGVVGDVLAGGKRLRGCLVCLLSDALGGTRAAAIPRAMAVECVHAASLIHDDLVDDDTSRRNRAATWTTEGPRRAVLLADAMFAIALARMVELGQDDGRALSEAIATMAAGAYQEPLVQADLVRISSADRAGLYPRLIHLKTGFLFGTAARMGALAAGISSPLATLAFKYGALTGEAYQIADDLQDLVERPVDGTPTTAQAILAPALWHFCAEDPVKAACSLTPENLARLRPQLRSGMLAAIEARLQQAMAVADQFPSRCHKGLLGTAPRHIVRAMGFDAP